jgi:hypothetical protein
MVAILNCLVDAFHFFPLAAGRRRRSRRRRRRRSGR